MKDVFEQMLSRYDTTTAENRHNAICEVLQQVVLCGLYRDTSQPFCGKGARTIV